VQVDGSCRLGVRTDVEPRAPAIPPGESVVKNAACLLVAPAVPDEATEGSVEKPKAGEESTFTTAREFEAEPKIKVHVQRSRGTSVRRNIKPRAARGQVLSVKWPKDRCRSHQEAGAAFKWRIPALISSRSPVTIPEWGTLWPMRINGGFRLRNYFRNSVRRDRP
jgi:hypothetical protein